MDKKERDGVRFEGPKFCGRPSAAATVQRYGHSPYKMRQNSCEGWKAGGGGGARCGISGLRRDGCTSWFRYRDAVARG